MYEKFIAVANTSENGLVLGRKYILENLRTGSVYVYDKDGNFLVYCRKDSFDYWYKIT